MRWSQVWSYYEADAELTDCEFCLGSRDGRIARRGADGLAYARQPTTFP